MTLTFANHILGHISVTNGQNLAKFEHRVAYVKAYKRFEGLGTLWY